MSILTVADAVGALKNVSLDRGLPDVKRRTLPFDMNKVLNKCIQTRNREVGSDRGDHSELHVTEMAYWCPMRRFYDLQAIKKGIRKMPVPVPAAAQRLFDRGHTVHAMIQKWLGYSGAFFGDWRCKHCNRIYRFSAFPGKCVCGNKHYEYIELKVHYSFPDITGILVGSVDGVFFYQGEWYVIEVKSKGNFNFESIRNVARPHYIQVNIYMHLLGIKQAIVCYADPEQAKIAGGGFLVPYDPNVWTWVYQSLAAVETAAKNNSIKPLSKACTSQTSMLAKTCIHVDQCFSINKSRVKRVEKE